MLFALDALIPKIKIKQLSLVLLITPNLITRSGIMTLIIIAGVEKIIAYILPLENLTMKNPVCKIALTCLYRR